MKYHFFQKEKGIYIGNQIDKNQIKNPLGKKLIANFDRILFATLEAISPESIHEVGCGEGRLTRMLSEEYSIEILATDFSGQLIEENLEEELPGVTFSQLSIYDLEMQAHRRDVVICCEVLEHLENPDLALSKLRALRARAYLFSVPREPIWRILNCFRGKYLAQLGNTPGHLNHWNRSSFIRLAERHGFKVEDVCNPFPWIMVTAYPSGE